VFFSLLKLLSNYHFSPFVVLWAGLYFKKRIFWASTPARPRATISFGNFILPNPSALENFSSVARGFYLKK